MTKTVKWFADWRVGFGLMGTLIAFVVGIQVGASLQEKVTGVTPLYGRDRPASLAQEIKASDICRDPNAQVLHIVGGFIPRTEITLKLVNQKGNEVVYTVTVADGQEPSRAMAALDRSIDGAKDPESDTAPVDDELRACMLERAQQRQEGGVR